MVYPNKGHQLPPTLSTTWIGVGDRRRLAVDTMHVNILGFGWKWWTTCIDGLDLMSQRLKLSGSAVFAWKRGCFKNLGSLVPRLL